MKSVFLMVMFLLSFGLLGCTEEDPAKSLELNWNNTATLKGKIFMIDSQIDYEELHAYTTKGSLKDYFIVKLNYNDLVSGINGEYLLKADKISYNQSTCEFIIEVPVGVSGSNVSIAMNDFKGKLQFSDGSWVNVLWKASMFSWFPWVEPGKTHDLGEWTLDCNNLNHYLVIEE